MNKPQIKMEGDTLKITYNDGIIVDQDQDGKAAFKAEVSLNVEVQGMEAADELLKSTKIVEYIKAKLGKE